MGADKKQRICTKCNKKLPLTQFYKNSTKRGGYQTECKSCCHKCSKKWKINNKKLVKQWAADFRKRKPDYWRKSYYPRRYGITLEQYEQMLQAQKGVCAICGQKQKGRCKNLSVDHSHQTGHIRGLLCVYCNSRLLRHLRDNKKRAKGLVKYLTKALKEDKGWK